MAADGPFPRDCRTRPRQPPARWPDPRADGWDLFRHSSCVNRWPVVVQGRPICHSERRPICHSERSEESRAAAPYPLHLRFLALLGITSVGRKRHGWGFRVVAAGEGRLQPESKWLVAQGRGVRSRPAVGWGEPVESHRRRQRPSWASCGERNFAARYTPAHGCGSVSCGTPAAARTSAATARLPVASTASPCRHAARARCSAAAVESAISALSESP